MQNNPIQERFKGNPLIFGMFYFPDYFRKPSPPFHLKILQEASNNLNLAVQAPRGSAKSVILGFLMPVHDITYKNCHFIVIIMNTYAKAAADSRTSNKSLKSMRSLNLTIRLSSRRMQKEILSLNIQTVFKYVSYVKV